VNARLRAALVTRRRRVGTIGAGSPRPRRGDGYEFAELRAYVAGDDPRRIDWAATARAGDLQTRVMFEDHALMLAAVLDASRSMFVGRDRSLFDIASGALTTWYALAAAEDRCARVLSDRFVEDRRRRGRSAALLCSDARDEPGARFDDALRIASLTVPRDASVLIVSDFYELGALGEPLRRIASRCDCTALVVRDPWFDDLPLAGFVRLRDAESGAARRLFVGRRERERYRAAVAAREAAVCAALEAIGVRAAVLAGDSERALLEAFGLA
jgi:uncharacterized protein (DUF58 family)